MHPSILGAKYDRIARWWHERHAASGYGVAQVERALAFASGAGRALDVGCGAGGRIVRLLEKTGYAVTGIDVSREMIRLARENHPGHRFLHQDICSWQGGESFDFIVAWDSLFHLPLDRQRPVLAQLCGLLASGGVLIYTFGDAEGEHTDQWHDDTFYYSSIGINENLRQLMGNGLSVLHLELDQHPEPHVYVIARRPGQDDRPNYADSGSLR